MMPLPPPPPFAAAFALRRYATPPPLSRHCCHISVSIIIVIFVTIDRRLQRRLRLFFTLVYAAEFDVSITPPFDAAEIRARPFRY